MLYEVITIVGARVGQVTVARVVDQNPVLVVARIVITLIMVEDALEFGFERLLVSIAQNLHLEPVALAQNVAYRIDVVDRGFKVSREVIILIVFISYQQGVVP